MKVAMAALRHCFKTRKMEMGPFFVALRLNFVS
jgi:hypothetical protein